MLGTGHSHVPTPMAQEMRKPNEIRLDKIIVELQKLNKNNEIIVQALLKLLDKTKIDPKSVKKAVDKV